MESIIRLHPFADGNKRTALMTAYYLLKFNNYRLVIPPNVIEFLTRIADNKNQSQDDIDALIIEIAKWLGKHSSRDQFMHLLKDFYYVHVPFIQMIFRRITKKGRDKNIEQLIRWFALDRIQAGSPPDLVETWIALQPRTWNRIFIKMFRNIR